MRKEKLLQSEVDRPNGPKVIGLLADQQNLAKVPAARNYAMSELRKAGVEFHTLSQDQLAEWQEAGGYQRPEWDKFKTDLAGSMDVFAKLEEAANTQGRFYVHDA